jgi:nitroreductase
VVRARRMVRNYTGERVERAAVERILDAGRRAPSAGFSQGQRFVVLTDEGDRARMAECCDEPAYLAQGFDPWVSRAPVHVIPCVRPDDYRDRYAEPDKASAPDADEWRVPFWWVDAGASLMAMLLAAVDEGLAAGFLGVQDDGPARALLALPDDIEMVGLVTIGHPAPDRRSGSLRRGRRPQDDVVRWGRWA